MILHLDEKYVNQILSMNQKENVIHPKETIERNYVSTLNFRKMLGNA